jgi:hypothetical protein
MSTCDEDYFKALKLFLHYKADPNMLQTANEQSGFHLIAKA